MSNSVKRRVYYAIDIELASPLCVSNGEAEYSKADVIRNGDGELFVPGISLAGAFRNYIGTDRETESKFGYSNDSDSRMSLFYISDLYFSDKCITSVRDRVKLTDKLVDDKNGKFDMEIIETGAKGTIYINYLEREEDFGEKTSCEDIVKRIIQGIRTGEIRVGANKNRGFGKIKINNVYRTQFSCDTGDKNNSCVDEWIKFMENPGCLKDDSMSEPVYEDASVTLSEYIKISVPLELTGGISIKKYSSEPEKANYEHITCNGRPVIPGNSWNGAVRSDIISILRELDVPENKIVLLINMWFGYVDKNKKEARQSIIVFEESILDRKAKPILITRNRINRFDGSVIKEKETLYSSISYFKGRTSLNIFVKKDEDAEYMAFLALLDMAINDIKNGYVTIGGEADVARVILAPDNGKQINYSEDVDRQKCVERLYSLIRG